MEGRLEEEKKLMGKKTNKGRRGGEG